MKKMNEHVSRYPQAYDERDFVNLHQISINDRNQKPNAFDIASNTRRQNTRLADYNIGKDVAAYLGASELEKQLSQYPVEDINDYLERHNAGFVGYQDSRDERVATRDLGDKRMTHVPNSQFKNSATWDVEATDPNDSIVKYVNDLKHRFIIESISPGNLKLDNGSTVSVSKQDSQLLNKMLSDLNTVNKKKMEKVMMKDEAGFDEILSFAREAL